MLLLCRLHTIDVLRLRLLNCSRFGRQGTLTTETLTWWARVVVRFFLWHGEVHEAREALLTCCVVHQGLTGTNVARDVHEARAHGRQVLIGATAMWALTYKLPVAGLSSCNTVFCSSGLSTRRCRPEHLWQLPQPAFVSSKHATATRTNTQHSWWRHTAALLG